MSNTTMITCPDGFPLIELYEEKVCITTSTLLVTLIVFLSLFVLISIISLILYFHFENQVKIWLYNHKLLSAFIKEEDFDETKVYDAFISYSHKDEEFVAKYLVPELENGQQKYKLCLHERDWVVGEYIPKQITESVQNSRRTIIVLSRNFLQSDWANMEFKMAHDKSIDEERKRLIIILYENVSLNEIANEDLRIYLTTNTYIEWGDKWFWEKLRNSMPSSTSKQKCGKKTKISRNETTDVEKNVLDT